MRTHVYLHPHCLEHDPGPGHPESPARLSSILELLDQRPLAGVERHEARAATPQELLLAHQPEHVAQLQALAGKAALLEEDTPTSAGSHEAALRSAGAAAQATLAVWEGRARNAFAVARPPGHHAGAGAAMGFCLYNNVAVAAEVVRRAGAERVLVLDWDVHHGNGTQDIFEARRDVLFASLHQFPFYPGTGAPHEVGAAQGYTVNCGLPAGVGDADVGAVFQELFLPIAQQFRPQLVLVSAGFDAHREDPLGELRLSERGFAAMCSATKALAEEVCGGKVVLLLEGGYALGALARSVHACLEVLSGRKDEFPGGVSSAGQDALQASLEAQRRYWRL